MILRRQAENPLVREERVQTVIERIRRQMALHGDSMESFDDDELEALSNIGPRNQSNANVNKASSIDDASVGSFIEDDPVSVQEVGEGVSNAEGSGTRRRDSQT